MTAGIAIWIALVGCEAGGSPAPGHEHVHTDHGDRTPAAYSSGSLYALPLDLETHTGAHAALDLHRGHPVLLSMVYATCRDVCPATIASIHAIDGRVAADTKDDLRILLVSIDPARDTPEALAALAARHEVDARWTLARVPESQVRELAAALGVRYRQRPDGDFDHSAVVALLDRQGVVRARLDTLQAPPDALLAELAKL